MKCFSKLKLNAQLFGILTFFYLINYFFNSSILNAQNESNLSNLGEVKKLELTKKTDLIDSDSISNRGGLLLNSKTTSDSVLSENEPLPVDEVMTTPSTENNKPNLLNTKNYEREDIVAQSSQEETSTQYTPQANEISYPNQVNKEGQYSNQASLDQYSEQEVGLEQQYSQAYPPQSILSPLKPSPAIGSSESEYAFQSYRLSFTCKVTEYSHF